MIRDLVIKNRSCRRFVQDVPVSRQTLEELVDLARLSPSAGNLQPLKYTLSCDSQTNDKIFPHLAWAGYLEDWPGPEEGQRPTAYIIILGDTEIKSSFGCDHGIAAQSILLGATEKGLAGCIIGLIKRQPLRQALNIPERYEILVALALGAPAEQIVLDNVPASGDIKYWRDEQDVHHVPKRSLDTIIVS